MGIFYSTPVQRPEELEEMKPLNSFGMKRNAGKRGAASNSNQEQPQPLMDATQSMHELEIEFEKIHENSTRALKAMTQNPCEDLKMRVTHCLQNNADGMGKCFTVMDEYRECVARQMARKMGVTTVDNKKK